MTFCVWWKPKFCSLTKNPKRKYLAISPCSEPQVHLSYAAGQSSESSPPLIDYKNIEGEGKEGFIEG